MDGPQVIVPRHIDRILTLGTPLDIDGAVLSM